VNDNLGYLFLEVFMQQVSLSDECFDDNSFRIFPAGMLIIIRQHSIQTLQEHARAIFRNPPADDV
jgi:hypothetical protein